jgi:hypothetical protein
MRGAFLVGALLIPACDRAQPDACPPVFDAQGSLGSTDGGALVDVSGVFEGRSYRATDAIASGVDGTICGVTAQDVPYCLAVSELVIADFPASCLHGGASPVPSGSMGYVTMDLAELVPDSISPLSVPLLLSAGGSCPRPFAPNGRVDATLVLPDGSQLFETSGWVEVDSINPVAGSLSLEFGSNSISGRFVARGPCQ